MQETAASGTGRAVEARRGLLSASELAKLGDLMFVARRLVEGLYAGRHRSPRRGHSTEFYDYRPYVPGDEVRRVDWRVWARTDRLYVRRYRHDADLAVHVVLDRSGSMAFGDGGEGGGEASKWTFAQQVAAAVAFLVVRQGDRVGLTLMGEAAEPELDAGGAWAHLERVVTAMERAVCAGRTDPVKSLHAAHAAIRLPRHGRGLVLLISDLLDDPGAWLEGLGPFLHDQFDVAVMQVLTRTELDLRGVGGVRLVDAESGASVRTYGPEVRRKYEARMREHIERLREGLQRHGADHRLVLTNTAPIEVLRGLATTRVDAI